MGNNSLDKLLKLEEFQEKRARAQAKERKLRGIIDEPTSENRAEYSGKPGRDKISRTSIRISVETIKQITAICKETKKTKREFFYILKSIKNE
jgi:hypothetical protein